MATTLTWLLDCQGYFLVITQCLHTIIYEVAIGNCWPYERELFTIKSFGLLFWSFFHDLSHNKYVKNRIYAVDILSMTRLKFWHGCRYFWARHWWFSQCKRCGLLKISYLCPKSAPLYMRVKLETYVLSVNFHQDGMTIWWYFIHDWQTFRYTTLIIPT